MLFLLLLSLGADPSFGEDNEAACRLSVDPGLDQRLTNLCSVPDCETALRLEFRRELAAAKKQKTPLHEWADMKVGPSDWVAIRWLSSLSDLGEGLLGGRLTDILLVEFARELSSPRLADDGNYRSRGTCIVVPQRLNSALAAAVNRPMLSLPLSTRCALTKHLAQQVFAVHEWSHDLHITNGKFGFLVLLQDDVPLLGPGESCAFTGENLPSQWQLDPAQLRRVSYAFVDWFPLRMGSLPTTLNFRRSFHLGHPSPNIPGTGALRGGRTLITASLPTLEIDVEIEGDKLRTQRCELKFDLFQSELK